MRKNTEDKTLYRNYVRKWKFLIQEYELVKKKRHHKFRFAADFYRFHQTHRQTFFKYYHRFRQSGADHALVPQTREPKWKQRRGCGYIEQHVPQHRQQGVNRYEILPAPGPETQASDDATLRAEPVNGPVETGETPDKDNITIYLV